MSTDDAVVLRIIERAVREAIATVGIEGLKATSMFLSNASAHAKRKAAA